MSKTITRMFPVLSLALVWSLTGFAGATISPKADVAAMSVDSGSPLDDPAVSPSAEPQPARPLGLEPVDPTPILTEPVEQLRDSERVEPIRLRTCALDQRLLTGLDGELTLAVATTGGELLLGVEETTRVAPASVVKLFTAVAALRTLGPDFRFQTSVVKGANPGEVWLVGGGDVTLTRSLPNNYYDSEASLEDLARQTVDRLGIEGLTPTDLFVDTSRYAHFPQWDDSWRPGSSRLGFVAPVVALQVDGDRDQPGVRLSSRSGDPVSRATRWFADALSRASGQYPTLRGAAPAPEGRALAVVESAPLADLVGIMLVDSDNSLAEVVAREVALATGELDPGEAVLQAVGLPEELAEGASIRDGSGLSDLTEVSGEAVVWVLREIQQSPDLAAVREGLPVANETGSLRTRYGSVAGQLQGRVAAKTGSLRGVRSLAGFVDADDESELMFSAVLSGPRVSNASRDEIDRIVADLARCGENLADWNSAQTVGAGE